VPYLQANLLERRGADTEDVLTASLKGVESCDIYLGIFGMKYSEITLEEYRRAGQLGKHRLTYVRKTEKREPKLAEFIKEELSNQSKYHEFENDQTLVKQVRKDLVTLVVKTFKSETRPETVRALALPIGGVNTLVDRPFMEEFSEKLSMVTQILVNGSHEKTNEAIDVLVMMFKERIDKWDVPSVKFATEELFKNLYKFSEKGGMSDLYTIFKDLFARAYSERKHLLGAMIETIGLIMFESWVPLNDLEMGEKAAKVMLKLAIDFLNKDLDVARDCSIAIDNLAGDMFEPEILSKEILLASHALEKSLKEPRLQEFVKNLSDWVRINDRYAWDADIHTYLRDSIDYAEWERERYGIAMDEFRVKVLYPELQQTIDDQIQDYLDFLLDSQGDEATTFDAEVLVKKIRAYEFLRPNIASEIRAKVLGTHSSTLRARFDKIIHSNRLLAAIYGESEMITTFDELIRFLEANSDAENTGIGMTTFDLATIHFTRKLKESEEESLKQLARKYGVDKDFELGEQRLTFQMDLLVYLGEGQYDMKKLTSFLKEINTVVEIETFSTGSEFRLRRLRQT